MKTVVVGHSPTVVSLIAERQRLGLDTYDEVWHGEYYMAPAPSYEHGLVQSTITGLLLGPAHAHDMQVTGPFNLGDATDFRVPDLGVHRGSPSGVWLDTAAIVVEIRSPNDETLQKFEFYLRHEVDEILIVDLTDHSVQWFERAEDGYAVTVTSALLGLSSADAVKLLGWE
jgi:Uma2 family endonuclease